MGTKCASEESHPVGGDCLGGLCMLRPGLGADSRTCGLILAQAACGFAQLPSIQWEGHHVHFPDHHSVDIECDPGKRNHIALQGYFCKELSG